MQCPSKLIKNGSSPHGNILMAHFDTASCPDSVRVVLGGQPTNDVQGINGNSGMWISGNKYTSTDVSLQLLDQQGTVLTTCKYDISGQPAPNKDAEITNAVALFGGNLNANISFQSLVEVELRTYIIERFSTGTLDKVLLVAPKGANQDYGVLDDEVYSEISTYQYQISAIFNDNSKSLLVNLSITAS